MGYFGSISSCPIMQRNANVDDDSNLQVLKSGEQNSFTVGLHRCVKGYYNNNNK